MIIRLSAVLSMLLFFVVVSGCTGAAENTSLLSSAKSCASTNCGEETQTSITGELRISPDVGEIYANPEGSEMVEVAGTCEDLGRKQNQILVQVYEGENDAVAPILDNSVGINCQSNISTASLSDQTCLFVSQGIGLADVGQSTVQYPQCFNGRFSFKLRVGRIIRGDTTIGSARNDDTNPRTRYLVKLKLRTTDGAVADSGSSTLFVSRFLTRPISLSVTTDNDKDRCEVKLDPSKFRDIRYTVVTTFKGPTYMASAGASFTNSVSAPLYFDMPATFPPKDDGTTVERFFAVGEPIDFDRSNPANLMPGGTYTYSLQTADYSFVSDYMTQFGVASSTAVERSDFSTELSCVMAPAFVSNRNINTTLQQGVLPTALPNTCELFLGGANQGGYSLEWRVSDLGPNWMVTNPTAGLLISDGTLTDDALNGYTVSGTPVANSFVNCRSGPTCRVNGQNSSTSMVQVLVTSGAAFASGSVVTFQSLLPQRQYFFAVRHFRDSGIPSATAVGGVVSGSAGNSRVDVGELVGEWSPASPILSGANPTGSGMNHDCLFNTFPAQ